MENKVQDLISANRSVIATVVGVTPLAWLCLGGAGILAPSFSLDKQVCLPHQTNGVTLKAEA